LRIAVVGLGLIGGSFGLRMRELGHIVTGVDKSEENRIKAKDLGIVDHTDTLEGAISSSDMVVLAIPVEQIKNLLPRIMNMITKDQFVVDFGSTKKSLIDSIADTELRGRYLACHPMAGTEFSGPESAFSTLFEGTFMVICNREESDPDVLESCLEVFENIGAKAVYYDAESHDRHAAYVSHISHISSFALALTVLEKEENDEDILKLAAGGFTSTVRLAKSSADMWIPIFMENQKHVMDVLEEHIHQLGVFKEYIAQNQPEKLRKLIEQANTIKKII
jgi:prephenate dehydrogenase